MLADRPRRFRVVPSSRLPSLALAVALTMGLAGGSPGRGRAAGYETLVRAPLLAPGHDDASSVSVIELGLPGQAGAPSAYKVSLAEALGGQAGVHLRSAGGLGQWSGAFLRGAAASQVSVLVDGVPLSRGGQTSVDLSLVPIDGIERIEVYRGLPPLELGVETIGGAINLITRRGRGEGGAWALVGGGSFGLRKLAAGYGRGGVGLRSAATVSYQGAAGDFPYYTADGLLYGGAPLHELYRRNDGFDQVAADVRVGGSRGATSFYVSGHGLFKEQGVPGRGLSGAQPGRPRLFEGRALLAAGLERELAKKRGQLSVEVHVQLERAAAKDLDLLPPQHTEQLSVQTGARTMLRLFLPEVPVRSGEAGGLLPSLIFLVEGRYERLGSADLCPAPREGCGQSLPTRSQRLRGQLAAGGELRVDGDRLLISPAVQVLLFRSELLPLAGLVGAQEEASRLVQSEAFLAPRLLTRLRLGRIVALSFAGGRAVRLPTFLELFGDRAFFRPNLALRPESAWTLEAGAQATGRLRHVELGLEAHGFFRRIDDLIDINRDGALLRARNVGSAQTLGLELEGRLSYRDFVAARLAYTLLDARDQSLTDSRSGRRLPSRPPHSVALRLDGGYGSLRLGYELDYVAALYLDPANLQPRPARTLHALRVELRSLGPAKLSLSVEVRNLLDTRLVGVVLPQSGGVSQPAPLSDFVDYPLPGRALYATLGGRL